MSNKLIVSTLVLSFGMNPLGLCSVLQTPSFENPVNVAPRASITASSVYQDEYPEFGTQKLVDGLTGQDVNGYAYSQWLAKGTLEGASYEETGRETRRGTFPAWVKFDLLADYTLSGVSLFNTKNAPFNDTGTKDFNVQVSSDDINYFSAIVAGTLDWQNSSWQSFNFNNQIVARYVLFNLNSAYINPESGLYNRAGLQEVKITAVPEPSSLSLLALGGVVVALGRRKK
jgi:hypothetical protein